MVQSHMYGKVLYKTCYIWHSELKIFSIYSLQVKFNISLGTAGFYGIANRNVLSEQKWLGIFW